MKLTVKPRTSLRGRVRVPGDKSISHRAVMLASLARGCSRIRGFLFSQDCMGTVEAMRAMGVSVEREEGELRVRGAGLGGLEEPEDVLDLGNAGTAARLLSGLLCGQGFYAVLTGDDSLRGRPMDRIVEPLRRMGGRIYGRRGDNNLPLTILASEGLEPITYRTPVASAQIKSAVLLAGLYAPGRTRVIEPGRSRDHTERMLRAFGVEVEVRGTEISLSGSPRPELEGMDFTVPGDISSAAYLLAAGAMVPGSEVGIRDVGLNPTRSGIIEVMQEMGAELEIENRRMVCGEPVGDLRVRTSRLKGVEIGGRDIPRLLDEIPIIAILAGAASGVTTIRGAGELRVKESDRLSVLASVLPELGVRVRERPDGMIIRGRDGVPFEGGCFPACGDHRIALSLAVAGLYSGNGVSIRGAEFIETSFPGFTDLISMLE